MYIYKSIFEFASVASAVLHAIRGFAAAALRKHRHFPHRSRSALEMAARARSGPAREHRENLRKLRKLAEMQENATKTRQLEKTEKS